MKQVYARSEVLVCPCPGKYKCPRKTGIAAEQINIRKRTEGLKQQLTMSARLK
jgi:hypothetical protein